MVNRIFQSGIAAALCFALFTHVLPAQSAAAQSVLSQPDDTSPAVFTDIWKAAVRPDYSALDAYVKSCGSMSGSSPQDIAKKITSTCTSDLEKARAVFDWISYNIAYDTSYSIYTAEKAFKLRKGVCAGYSDLFQTMADAAGIVSRVVSGEAKNSDDYRPGGHLGGHAWNIVTLSGREILLDSTWGAGYVNGSTFTRSFDPSWFDPHPADYVFTHFPSSHYDQLLEPHISFEDFKSLPHVTPRLMYSGLEPGTALSFFMEHPEYNGIETYASWRTAFSAGGRLYEMPIERQLQIGRMYTLKFDEQLPFSVTRESETAVENGIKTITFTPKSRGTISIVRKSQNRTHYLAQYVVVENPPQFSNRKPSPGMIFEASPPVKEKPFVMREVSLLSSPDGAVYISETELPYSEWSKFRKKTALNDNAEYESNSEPAVFLKEIEALEYCNWRSAEDGLTPYYIEENGTYFLNREADGYRLPTVQELTEIVSSGGYGLKGIINPALTAGTETGAGAALTAGTETGAAGDVSTPDVRAFAWYAENSGGRQYMTGQRAADTFGLFDILGNGAELCMDEKTQSFGVFGGSVISTREELESPSFTPNEGGNVIPFTAMRLVRRLPRTGAEYFKTASAVMNGKLFRQDIEKGFSLFLSGAERDHPPSMYMAGYCYANGFGTPINEEKAVYWIFKAADSGNTAGCWRKGQILDDGLYHQAVNKDEAVKLYIQAADGGHKEAMLFMSAQYYEGSRVERDYEKSFFYLHKAHETGNADTAVRLARYYQDGIGTPADSKKAYELFVQAGREGSLDGLIGAADCSYNGIGTSKDVYTAYRRYEQAAEKGSTYARYMTGKMAYLGEGRRRNIDDALKILTRLEYPPPESVSAAGTGASAGSATAAQPLESASSIVEKINALKKFTAAAGKTAQDYFNTIPSEKDPHTAMSIFIRLSETSALVNGKAVINPFMFRGMNEEDIQKKIIKPMTDLAAAAPAAGAAQTAQSSGKTVAGAQTGQSSAQTAAGAQSVPSSIKERRSLVIVVPSSSKPHSLVSSIYNTDFFVSKGLYMNGERYRCDQSFADYYDEFLICSVSSAKTVFSRIFARAAVQPASAAQSVQSDAQLTADSDTSAPSSQSSISRTDILCVGSSLYTGGSWIVDKNAFSLFWTSQIERGITPRLITLGDSTDSIQIPVTALLGAEKASRIKVFGTPLAMTGEIAAGFRSGTLSLFLLAKPFTAAAAARIYIYETAAKNAAQKSDLPPSFVFSADQIKTLRTLPIGKGGTAVKTGSMIMDYSIVKPIKKLR